MSDPLPEVDPLAAALLRVERAQEGREAALDLADSLIKTLTVLTEVIVASPIECRHPAFDSDCAPCVRREILTIIKHGVESAPH